MAINVQTENLIRLKEVPDWFFDRTRKRINRSTVVRWTSRGARGVKLETILLGGIRFTSIEKLQSFFDSSTAAGERSLMKNKSHSASTSNFNQSESEVYLASEWE